MSPAAKVIDRWDMWVVHTIAVEVSSLPRLLCPCYSSHACKIKMKGTDRGLMSNWRGVGPHYLFLGLAPVKEGPLSSHTLLLHLVDVEIPLKPIDATLVPLIHYKQKARPSFPAPIILQSKEFWGSTAHTISHPLPKYRLLLCSLSHFALVPCRQPFLTRQWRCGYLEL